MPIAATYINESQFSVEGDVIASLRIGTPINLVQSPDDVLETFVANIVYNAGTNLSTITTEDSGITDNLSLCYRGHTFVDRTNQQSNLAKHQHTEKWDGGYCAFGGFTDADIVSNLNIVGSVSESVENFVMGVADGGLAAELKEVVAVANQTTVVHEANKITVGTAQNIGTTSSPEFAGLTLTDEEGVLVGDADGIIGAIAATAPNQVLIQKEDDSGFEVADLEISRATDVTLIGLAHDHGLFYDSVSGKFVNKLASSGSGTADLADIISMVGVFAEQPEEAGIQNVSELDGDKLVVDYTAINYVPVVDSGNTTETDQITSHIKGLDASLPAPDLRAYCPTPFLRASTTEVTLQAGTYWMTGGRWLGAYEKYPTKRSIVAADSDHTLENIIDVGGAITGSVIEDSWYAIFLNYDITTPILSALPFFRVKETLLSSGYTRLYPGTHNDHTVAESDFIKTDNHWNDYRLVKPDGTVYTITDTEESESNPDYLVLTGDLTAAISAGDWFLLLPPSTDAFVYLGVLRTTNTGTIEELERKYGTWEYFYNEVKPSVAGNLHGDTPSEVDLTTAISPNADKAELDLWVAAEDTVNNVGVQVHRDANDSTGRLFEFFSVTAGELSATFPLIWSFSGSVGLHHYFWQGLDVAADVGTITIHNFSE